MLRKLAGLMPKNELSNICDAKGSSVNRGGVLTASMNQTRKRLLGYATDLLNWVWPSECVVLSGD